MVFSSLIFLFAFLPLTLAVYFLSPRRWRNAILFALSLLFYGWGEPLYLFLMLASLTLAYFLGRPIGAWRERDRLRARFYMLLSVGCSLLFLFFFKYYNFFAANLSRIPGVILPQLDGLRLPIGISFYTFQIISYTLDVYRGDTAAQHDYIAFGTYVTLFPQLIAGPIVKYRDIDRDLTGRRERISDFAAGVERFVVGLSKKVIFGDLLAAISVYYRTLFDLSPSVLGAWMTILLYSLHLYFDFSGYSDMAIGLGKMFGFSFPENFNYPAISRSITEFWRRWHISLSTWFREYVYIPLGGNRHGLLRCCRNLALVWLLTGFWHGADWNFLLWGVYFAVLLILEKLFLLRALERLPAIVRHLYAVVLILIGFLIFSTPNLAKGLQLFGALFGVGTVGLGGDVASYQLLRTLPLITVAVVGATPLPHMLWTRLRTRHRGLLRVTPILTSVLFLLCVSYLTDSTFSPFEYTQF